MPIEQPEKGIRQVARYRYRQTIGPAKGWDDSHDPSTLEPEYLVTVINARIHDGIMVSRGGQSVVVGAGHEMTGCVYGMVEVVGGVFANKMLLHIVDVPQIMCYDPEKDPPDDLVSCTDISTDTNVPAPLEIPAYQRFDFIRYNGSVCWITKELVAGGGSYVYVLRRMVPPAKGDTSTGLKSEAILTLDFQPSSMATLPAPGDGTGSDVLFFGTVDGGVVVYTEDGELHEIAPAATFGDRVILFAYHDTIYAASLQEIRRLNGWAQGATSWSWTDVTMPAGAYPTGVSGFFPTGWAILGDDAYICGWDTLEDPTNGPGCILKLTESSGGALSCTVWHAVRDVSTPPNTTVAFWISDIGVIDGKLFYGWTGRYQTPVTIITTVGYWDGAAFNDMIQAFAEAADYVGRIYYLSGRLYLTAESGASSTLYAFNPSTVQFDELILLPDLCCDMIGI